MTWFALSCHDPKTLHYEFIFPLLTLVLAVANVKTVIFLTFYLLP